jgi:hypothetical protein
MFNNQHNCGHLYDHLMSLRISTSIMYKIFYISSKIYEGNGHDLDLDLVTIMCNTCFISYEKVGY